MEFYDFQYEQRLQFIEQQIQSKKIQKCNSIFDQLGPDQNDHIHMDKLEQSLKGFCEVLSKGLKRFFEIFIRQTRRETMSRKYFSMNVLLAVEKNKFDLRGFIVEYESSSLELFLHSIDFSKEAKEQKQLDDNNLESPAHRTCDRGYETPFTKPIESNAIRSANTSNAEESINTSINRSCTIPKNYHGQPHAPQNTRKTVENNQTNMIWLGRSLQNNIHEYDNWNGISESKSRNVSQRMSSGLPSQKTYEQDIRESLRKQFSMDLIEPTENFSLKKRQDVNGIGEPVIRQYFEKLTQDELFQATGCQSIVTSENYDLNNELTMPRQECAAQKYTVRQEAKRGNYHLARDLGCFKGNSETQDTSYVEEPSSINNSILHKSALINCSGITNQSIINSMLVDQTQESRDEKNTPSLFCGDKRSSLLRASQNAKYAPSLQKKMLSQTKSSHSYTNTAKFKNPAKGRNSSIIPLSAKKPLVNTANAQEKVPPLRQSPIPKGFAPKRTTHFIKSTLESSSLNLKEHLKMRQKFHLSLLDKKSNSVSFDNPRLQIQTPEGPRKLKDSKERTRNSFNTNDSINGPSGRRSKAANELQGRKCSPTLIRQNSQSIPSYSGLYARSQSILNPKTNNNTNLILKTPVKSQQFQSEYNLSYVEFVDNSSPSKLNLNKQNSASKFSASVLKNRPSNNHSKENVARETDIKSLNNCQVNGYIRRNRSGF